MHLRSFAVVGARSSDLVAQLDRALPTDPDVAVILIGVNDVTHQVLPAHVGAPPRPRRYAVSARPGARSIVGTCPDLGTIKPVAPPLRQVGRAWSRRLATAQTIAVVEAGGRTVSLGAILGPEFAAAPALLFGPDQFHPSADGYRSLAQVLLPSTLAALGLIREDEAEPEAYRGEGVLPIAAAAVQAVATPGTELDGTEVGGAAPRRTRPLGGAPAPPPRADGRRRGTGHGRGRTGGCQAAEVAQQGRENPTPAWRSRPIETAPPRLLASRHDPDTTHSPSTT